MDEIFMVWVGGGWSGWIGGLAWDGCIFSGSLGWDAL